MLGPQSLHRSLEGSTRSASDCMAALAPLLDFKVVGWGSTDQETRKQKDLQRRNVEAGSRCSPY